MAGFESRATMAMNASIFATLPAPEGCGIYSTIYCIIMYFCSFVFFHIDVQHL